ncbi:MAG: GspE/PulE family protein, partial [Myxococcales bacterium]|nr:GspE/PulE family protein [Myxococcales bacterium]
MAMQGVDFLGEVLLRRGVLSPERLDAVYAVQKERGGDLRDLVVNTHAAEEAAVAQALADEAGLPYLEKIDVDAIPASVASRLPIAYAKQHRLLVLDEPGDQVKIAVADPFDLHAIDDVRALFGCPVQVFVASGDRLFEAINRVYERAEQGGGDLQANQAAEEEQDDEDDLLHAGDDEAPIIRWVNKLFFQALKDRASDIHIEPYERDLLVRFRIDGVLYDILSPPKRFQPIIISRIKVMAGLNIAEKRLPQDGRIRIRLAGKDIDIRVSIVPTAHGERVVMRLLDRASTLLQLEELGLTGNKLDTVNRLIRQSHGIILVTGPTGSGKTTTLYACLAKINTTDKNIITIEDPIEYQLHGIGQIQVNPKIDLTFANGLRSILRQDPDVIMVGEIRDT